MNGLATVGRNALIHHIKDRMVVRDDNVTTSGGEQTKVYLDIPGVLRDQRILKLASTVLYAHLLDHQILNLGGPDMIGGPMTGSIPLVTGLALRHHNEDTQWFIIRDKPKTHGLGREFVGAEPKEGDRVILVDDVVSTGNSLKEAWDKITSTGAKVVAVAPLVDRGNNVIPDPTLRHCTKWGDMSVPYLPVLTYSDLGIPPLGA